MSDIENRFYDTDIDIDIDLSESDYYDLDLGVENQTIGGGLAKKIVKSISYDWDIDELLLWSNITFELRKKWLWLKDTGNEKTMNQKKIVMYSIETLPYSYLKNKVAAMKNRLDDWYSTLVKKGYGDIALFANTLMMEYSLDVWINSDEAIQALILEIKNGHVPKNSSDFGFNKKKFDDMNVFVQRYYENILWQTWSYDDYFSLLDQFWFYEWQLNYF